MLKRLCPDESIDQLNLNFLSEECCSPSFDTPSFDTPSIDLDEDQMEQIRAARIEFKANKKRKKQIWKRSERTIQMDSYKNDIEFIIAPPTSSDNINNENNINKIEYYRYKDIYSDHSENIYNAYCKIGRGDFYQFLSGFDPLINVGCPYDPTVIYGPILREKIMLHQKEKGILKLR